MLVSEADVAGVRTEHRSDLAPANTQYPHAVTGVNAVHGREVAAREPRAARDVAAAAPEGACWWPHRACRCVIPTGHAPARRPAGLLVGRAADLPAAVSAGLDACGLRTVEIRTDRADNVHLRRTLRGAVTETVIR